jgi:hypothetical protein
VKPDFLPLPTAARFVRSKPSSDCIAGMRWISQRSICRSPVLVALQPWNIARTLIRLVSRIYEALAAWIPVIFNFGGRRGSGYSRRRKHRHRRFAATVSPNTARHFLTMLARAVAWRQTLGKRLLHATLGK